MGEDEYGQGHGDEEGVSLSDALLPTDGVFLGETGTTPFERALIFAIEQPETLRTTLSVFADFG